MELAQVSKPYARKHVPLFIIQKKAKGVDALTLPLGLVPIAKYSFREKSPLGKKEMDAIKQDMAMQKAETRRAKLAHVYINV